MRHYFIMTVIALFMSACSQPSAKVENTNAKQATQTDEMSQLHKRLDAYFVALESQQIDTMLDMIYYKVYTVIPRDIFKKMYDQAQNNSSISKILSNTYDKNIQIKNYSNGQYARITWNSEAEMPTRTTNPKKEDFLLDYMKKMMKKIMNNTTLTLDRKQHKLHLSIKKRSMLAIKENGRKWEVFSETRPRPIRSKQSELIRSKLFDILPKDIKPKVKHWLLKP